MPELLPFADAAALLEQVRLGHLGLQDLPGYPMLVVDVDDGAAGEHSALVPAAGWPVLVVGVGRAASASPASPATAGPDVLLTDNPDPGAPWVWAEAGIEKALLDLRDAVCSRPHASTTLAQVLRSTGTSPVGEALVVESLAYAALQGGGEHRQWLAQLSRPRPDHDPAPCVQLEREGPVLQITLNRPSRRNAYSSRMRDELVAALEVAAADEAIELVELRGEGPNFCSGGDLSEFGTVSDTATAHWIRMQRNAGWWVDNLRHKTVVHVHGTCVGAGVELPAFAGTVVADAKATFALPEVTMGLIPGAGGTVSIPRRIGRQRTAWMSLTGHTLTAQQALDWGLVDRLSADANRS